MLTDAEARDLLQAAAATIEVDAGRPVPVVDRPRLWPMLAAAAAVVAVVIAALALPDRGAYPPPTSSPSPTPVVNRVPPVMGLDISAARDLLRVLDVRVELAYQDDCVNEEVVAGSTPPAGAGLSAGDTVTLSVLRPDPLASCIAPDTWGLLRFALGVAAPPALADMVTLYPGAGEPVVLTAAEARDPENWEVCDGDSCGSALSILAEGAAQPSASLELRDGTGARGDPESCFRAEDRGPDWTSVGITIDPPTDGIGLCPEVVAYHADGALAAVAIPLARDDQESDPASAASAAADAFVAWARGSGVPPVFAGRVRYLVNDSVVREMSGANADRPGRWRVCYSGVPLGCPSPWKTLKYYDGRVVQSTRPASSCVERGQLPTDLAQLHLVRLDQPEARDCRDAFAVEVFTDDQGRIAAINLLPGSAAGPAY